jgi:hypothetical protein
VRGVKVRLGVPCYAGDTLVLAGRVVEVGPAARDGSESGVGSGDGGEVVVEVIGRCGLGDHVTGRVRVVWA